METLPIWRRLFGSVMDKLIILVLFIIIGCILSPYGFSGDLGTFVGGILKDSPSSFQYTELAALKRHDETLNLSLLDFKICFLFILVNVVYYLFGESVVRGSFGKRIFEGIVATKDGNAIPRYKYILRALTLGVLMALFSYLRYIIDISYTMTIVLFFMILDIPVLISRKSLIDIITNTIYIRRTKAQEQTERQTNNADKGNRKTYHLLSKKKVSFLKAGLCIFSLIFVILLLFGGPMSIHNLKFFHKIGGTDIYTLSEDKITTRTKPVLNNRCGPIPHGVFQYAIEGNIIANPSVSIPYSISVYDVSSHIENFPNKESYKHLLHNFDKRLQAYKRYHFDIMSIKNPVWHWWYSSFYNLHYTGATRYLFYDAETYERGSRTVFFENKKVYILEVKGAEDDNDLATATDNVINEMTTLPLNEYNIRILLGTLLFLILTVLCFGGILGFYRQAYKANITNKTANKLIKYSTHMSIISGILSLIISILYAINVGTCPNYVDIYYSPSFPDVPSTLCIVGVISVLLNVTLVIPYIYTRSCHSDKYDYLIPEKISKWMDKKLTDEREKRSLVALFFYPLYTGLPLPLGIGIFGYIIPFGVILYISIQIRSLSGWIKAEDKQDKKNVFCDYYVLLNLTFEATQEDIDKAFNAHLAKYNADSNNPLYGKDYLSELREAYAVLSSSNQLRPQYDNEYQLYKQSNLVNYEFENKQLEMSIQKIRTKLYGTSKTKKTLNVITLSFLILWMLVFIALCIFDVIPLSDWLNFENDDNYYGPSDF